MDNQNSVVVRSRMGKLKNRAVASYDELKTSYETYGFWRWIGIFFVGLIIGVAVGLALAGIIYGIRSNDPENKLTFQQAVEKTILSGIYFGFTCSLLYVLSKKYGYNLELIIMSAILLAGILASIGTSIPWQSLIGIGIVILGVPLMMGIRKIKKYYKDKANREYEERHGQESQELQELQEVVAV